MVLTLLGALLIDWIDNMGGPVAFRMKFGLFAPVLTVTLHIILALTPFPSDAVSISNGAMYGFRLGVGLSWFGWWLAALAEFALGRRAGIDFCLDTALAKTPGWVQRFPISHPAYLILSRQIPWLGGHISTFVPGAAGVSWRRYAWCSAIAIIPGALIMTGIGVGIMQLQSRDASKTNPARLTSAKPQVTKIWTWRHQETRQSSSQRHAVENSFRRWKRPANRRSLVPRVAVESQRWLGSGSGDLHGVASFHFRRR